MTQRVDFSCKFSSIRNRDQPRLGIFSSLLKNMFTVKYSPAGSSAHKLERDTFMMFMDYLHECEKEKKTLDFKHFLSITTATTQLI